MKFSESKIHKFGYVSWLQKLANVQSMPWMQWGGGGNCELYLEHKCYRRLVTFNCIFCILTKGFPAFNQSLDCFWIPNYLIYILHAFVSVTLSIFTIHFLLYHLCIVWHAIKIIRIKMFVILRDEREKEREKKTL